MSIRSPFDESNYFPELTPLIDMMFLLLIFFMLTSTFLEETQQKSIPVELPLARHSSIVTSTQAVVITVNENGDYSVDGRPCSADLLPDVIKIKTVGDSTVVISGHAKAPYRSIILIYDILQSLGISHFAHNVN